MFINIEEALKLSKLAQVKLKSLTRRLIKGRERKRKSRTVKRKAEIEAQLLGEESKKKKLGDQEIEQSIATLYPYFVTILIICSLIAYYIIIHAQISIDDDLKDSNPSDSENTEESEQDHSFGDYISK